MRPLQDIRAGFGVLLLVKVAGFCTALNVTSEEVHAPGVVTSTNEGGTCSYVLTVPKEPCKCDCIREFQQLTMEYERRLGEVERMLLRVFEALPDEEDDDGPFSSALGPNIDSVPVYFPEDDVKPPAPQKDETTTEPAPPTKTVPPTKPPAIVKDDDPVEKTTSRPTPTATSKPTILTVNPFRTEEEKPGADINLHMTVDIEEPPRQMDVVSATLVLSDSSANNANPGVPTTDVPPPIDPINEVQEDPTPDDPPAPINLNLPANDGGQIITPDIEELNRALKTPKKTGKARPASPPVEREGSSEEGREDPTPPRRLPPPGFSPGMERSVGFNGELNRPQWRKLADFLEAANANMTANKKRRRPSGIERVPTCSRDGCGCLVSEGRTESGVYLLPNVPGSGKRGVLVEMYCDLETNDGGWTVIQRRQNGSANFYRNWNHYAHGFGYLDGSFWIGNRMLHAITQRYNYEIRIEFNDWDGKFGFAEYDRFYVGPEERGFQLALGKYRAGNRGNAFSYHNGAMFSTFDQDNDKSTGECAVLRQAGFWFKNCNKMNPNGRWIPFPDATGLNGAVITWGTWSRHLYTYSMKDFRMMIRPTEPTDFA